MAADNTSRWLLPVWVHLFGPISAAHWAVVHHWIRKTGHFLGYGLLSVAFFHGWRTSLPVRHVQALWRWAAVLAVACTLLVASADEYHQSFLPSRTSSPWDVGIDLCGAIAAQLFVICLMPLILRNAPLQA